MSDYSDLLYTIFSIVIFSFLLLQANSLILKNDAVTVNHEYEKTAIALAQSIIDEAKTLPFDSNTNPTDIPDDFLDPNHGDFGWDLTTERRFFTKFDDFDGYGETVPTQLGNYVIAVTVSYVNNEPPFDEVNLPTVSKRISVTASHVATDDSATLVYIRTFFFNSM